VTASIEARERDVQRAFKEALSIATGAANGPLQLIETSLWSAMLALGRALIALYLARAASRTRARTYVHRDAEYVLDGSLTTEIGTRFGRVEFCRPVGRRVRWRRAARDRPVDRELGLCSGFSLTTVTSVTRLCAQLAFANARATFASFCEWMPSQRSVLRMVDAVGAKARDFMQAAAAPDGDGDILVIQVDGRGAPMVDRAEIERRRRPRRHRRGPKRLVRRQRRKLRERPRRTKGDKSKNAKVAFVGVIYTLRTTAAGCEGPINKRLCATFESHAALFTWLALEAKKRGYGRKRTLFLADGAEVIWDLQQLHFPDAEPGLDWFHVVEKVWAAGRSLHQEGSAALVAWVGERIRELRQPSGAGKVITAMSQAYATIPKTGPGTKAKREKLLEVMQHFSKHQQRMKYNALRRADLDIGSGAVEGAVRNLVGMRLDGPGMRWSLDRAERVLHLRCVLLNRQWDDFVEHLANQPTPLHLAATPTPTRSHDAVKRAA